MSFAIRMASRIYRRSTNNCTISMCSKTNDLTIRKGAQLNGVTITITGKDNSLIIDEDAVIRGGEIVVQDERTHVRIGARTRLESVSILAGGGEPILIGSD